MTVSTFHPDTGGGSTTTDGRVRNFVTSTIWATVHDAAAGDFESVTNDDESTELRASTTTDQYERIQRIFFTFDSAALPDSDTIDSATFELVGQSSVDDFTSSVALIISTQASDNDLVTGDFDAYTVTRQATDRTIAGLTFNDTDFQAWTLNSTGLAGINKTGITKYALLIDIDADDAEPTWASGSVARCRIWFADETLGFDARPKLVVTHSAAGVSIPIAAYHYNHHLGSMTN